MHKYLQLKCEVIEKNLTGYEGKDISDGFRFKVLHVALSASQQENEGARHSEVTHFHETY